MATEPNAGNESRSMERPPLGASDFAKVFGEEPAATTSGDPEPGTTETSETPTETPATPAAEGTEGHEAPDPMASINEFVDGFKDEEEPVAEVAKKPEESVAVEPEAQQIQEWVKNPEAGKEAVRYAVAAYHMTQALNGGKAKEALAFIAAPAQELLKDYFFETFKDEFALKIAGEEPAKPSAPSAEVKQLQADLAARDARIQAIEQKLTAKDKQELDAQQAAERSKQLQQRKDRFEGYFNELFNRAKVTDADERDALQGWVMRQVSKDPNAIAQVQKGQLAPLGKAFQTIFPKWSSRRVGVKTETTVKADGAPKPGGAASEPSTASKGFDPNFDAEDSRSNFISRSLKKVAGWQS